MIVNIHKRHLGRLIEETLITLDILMCHPTMQEVRGWYKGNRPMIDLWVNGKNHLNMAFTENTVHVKFHSDAGHVELHVAKHADQAILVRMRKDAAAIETLMAALRLYSTRKFELK